MRDLPNVDNHRGDRHVEVGDEAPLHNHRGEELIVGATSAASTEGTLRAAAAKDTGLNDRPTDQKADEFPQAPAHSILEELERPLRRGHLLQRPHQHLKALVGARLRNFAAIHKGDLLDGRLHICVALLKLLLAVEKERVDATKRGREGLQRGQEDASDA